MAEPVQGGDAAASTYDALIVGGGPAGLSCALVLGRCRRSVLLIDSGQYRNAATHAVHGYLTRDGTPPEVFLSLAREQLRPYGVERLTDEVIDARRSDSGFEVTTQSGRRLTGRKLLLATGIVDKLPAIEGFDGLYGVSAFHCPYCDGWEHRDKRILLYARGEEAVGFALTMLPFSMDLVIASDGPADLQPHQRARLDRHGIRLIETGVERFEGRDGRLTAVVFKDGARLERDSLFFHLGQRQRSDLAARLGVEASDEDGVQADESTATNIAGLYVAGDATRDVQQVIVAAAEGYKAAFEINTALRDEDYR